MSAKNRMTQRLLWSICWSILLNERWCHGETWWIISNPPVTPMGWQEVTTELRNTQSSSPSALVCSMFPFCQHLVQRCFGCSQREGPSRYFMSHHIQCVLQSPSASGRSPHCKRNFTCKNTLVMDLQKALSCKPQNTKGRVSLFHVSSELVD